MTTKKFLNALIAVSAISPVAANPAKVIRAIAENQFGNGKFVTS